MKSRELSFAIRAICDADKSAYDENIGFLRNTLNIFKGCKDYSSLST